MARRPFSRLVRHFLDRLVRGGDSSSPDFKLGIGPLFGLLAAPGAFQCFLMLDKYSSLLSWMRRTLRSDLLLASAPDKYMFLSIAMAVVGIVTVLKWDKILPDSQDFTNLAPLPIRPRTILMANAAAIAITALVMAVVVNSVSMVLFPMFVAEAAPDGAIDTPAFLAVHALCINLASIFAFCSVFSILGIASAILPPQTFKAWSSWLRGLLIVVFIALLVSGLAAPALVRDLGRAPDSVTRFLPPMWFLGLYQLLQSKATPQLAHLAPLGPSATAAALGGILLSYGLGYRRRFAAVLEGQRPPSTQRFLGLVLSILDVFAPKGSGFGRACHRFIVRAVLRHETQRLCIVVSLGLGGLLAIQSFAAASMTPPEPGETRPALGMLAAPLLQSYVLLLGLRVAFELPTDVPANWVFRLILDPREHTIQAVGRRVMLAFLLPLVVLPCFLSTWWWAGPVVAAMHTASVLALSLCLMEALLSGYRKIPFTTYMPEFRQNLPMLCLIHLIGLAAFANIGAGLDQWLLSSPLRALPVAAVALGAWHWNRRRLLSARESGEEELGLTFDHRSDPAVERLRLFDHD
jgi:hypothetical protein